MRIMLTGLFSRSCGLLLCWIRAGDEPIEKPQESLTSASDSARGRFQCVVVASPLQIKAVRIL